MTTKLALDVQGLRKNYGSRPVVSGLDLRVPQGAVAGFIGPNGAGKTTTLRMLLGLVRPTGGDGTVLGEPFRRPARYLPRVGALIESPAFYPALSGARNLEALAVLGGHPPARVPDVLELVGLGTRGADAYRTYSLGMKQRLGIAAALLSAPELLVLDEPTNGLDPAGIREMRDLLASLAADGLTVLVSSHLLAELQQVCDWLIVLDQGHAAYQGPAVEFLADGDRVLLRPESAADLPTLHGLLAGYDPIGEGGAITIAVDDNGRLGTAARAAFAAGITLVEIRSATASLEQRYTDLVAPGGSL